MHGAGKTGLRGRAVFSDFRKPCDKASSILLEDKGIAVWLVGNNLVLGWEVSLIYLGDRIMMRKYLMIKKSWNNVPNSLNLMVIHIRFCHLDEYPRHTSDKGGCLEVTHVWKRPKDSRRLLGWCVSLTSRPRLVPIKSSLCSLFPFTQSQKHLTYCIFIWALHFRSKKEQNWGGEKAVWVRGSPGFSPFCREVGGGRSYAVLAGMP